MKIRNSDPKSMIVIERYRPEGNRVAGVSRWRVFVVIGLLTLGWCTSATGSRDILNYGHFRNVVIRGETQTPSHVVLFASEKGAATPDMETIADALTVDGSLLIWIDVVDYLRSLSTATDECVYPAGDVEMLSQYIQRKLGLAAYRHPILAGHGPGAALVYAILAEAPQTFPGAISIDFSPDLKFGKALCKGKWLDYNQTANNHDIALLPSKQLDTPWIVFQTGGCGPCDLSETKVFVNRVGNGQINSFSKRSDGSSIGSDAFSKIRAAVQTIADAQTRKMPPRMGRLDDLPLVEVACPSCEGSVLAVIVSGDGGWAGIDSDMGDMLSANGIPVVGLDSLKYFWTHRTPDSAAHDLERIIDHYSITWRKRDILLIGYSRGADVLPFMVNRLSQNGQGPGKSSLLIGAFPCRIF